MLAPANAMDKKKEIIETEKEELLQARVCAKNRKGLYFIFAGEVTGTTFFRQEEE